MAFHKYGKMVKFPRNEHVDIHVREVTLNAEAPVERQAECIEFREWIRSGEVYGHGLVVDRRNLSDLRVALERLEAQTK